jgi:hypothetical protein
MVWEDACDYKCARGQLIRLEQAFRMDMDTASIYLFFRYFIS